MIDFFIKTSIALNGDSTGALQVTPSYVSEMDAMQIQCNKVSNWRPSSSLHVRQYSQHVNSNSIKHTRMLTCIDDQRFKYIITL